MLYLIGKEVIGGEVKIDSEDYDSNGCYYSKAAFVDISIHELQSHTEVKVV